MKKKRKHIKYYCMGEVFILSQYKHWGSPEFKKEFKETFGMDYKSGIHDHRLDGPAIEWDDGTDWYIINGAIIDETDYMNHPEVKKYLLLKAIKNLDSNKKEG
jgi:hypothetical protein